MYVLVYHCFVKMQAEGGEGEHALFSHDSVAFHLDRCGNPVFYLKEVILGNKQHSLLKV